MLTRTKILLSFLVLPILTHFLFQRIISNSDGNSASLPPLDHGTGSMFDLIATRYDFINRALALNLDIGWRKVMVGHVLNTPAIHSVLDKDSNEKDSGVKLLDLATGTADVAILLAKEYQALTKNTKSNNYNNYQKPIQILGVDPSANMIQVGNEKLSTVPSFEKDSEDVDVDIHLQLGDARNLVDLDQNTYHAATMSFGIRNVPEKDQVLCEIHRVLHKSNDNGSSRLAILEFSEPDVEEAGIMGYAARWFIRNVVPVVGAILSGAPKEYLHLQNSIKEFPSPKEFAQLMEGIRCDYDEAGRKGTFVVEDLIQLNFGSVQLYLAKPIFL